MKKLIIGGYDLETTGFCEPEHRIIEACVIRYEYDPVTHHWHHLDTNTWRINPERSIPAGATAVHKIVASDLVGKPTFKQVAPALTKCLDSCDIVAGHNLIEFDAPFTIMELERVRHPIPNFEPFDTMLEARWSTAYGEVPNLQKLCIACGVDYDPAVAHAAEYDVQKTLDCLFWGLQYGWFTLPLAELPR